MTAPISVDLLSVPGIGEAGRASLQSRGIHTTYALVGEILKLRPVSQTLNAVQTQKFVDDCSRHLQEKLGVDHERGLIVLSLAELIEKIMPGCFPTHFLVLKDIATATH